MLIYSDIITQAVFVGLHKFYIKKKYELKNRDPFPSPCNVSINSKETFFIKAA